MAEYFTTILELGERKRGRKGQGEREAKMEDERELPLPQPTADHPMSFQLPCLAPRTWLSISVALPEK